MKLSLADSLFAAQNYQEAFSAYADLLINDEVYSPSMLLKMAFVAEGTGDYAKASFYLAKYYDQNPNPRVITKIKSLTEQANLIGYELDDSDRFFKIATDFQEELTSVFSILLILSLILLVALRKKVDHPKYYLPAILFLSLTFISNNFLFQASTGIVTGSPTLIMEKPTAGGKLLSVVDPGHRVIIKSSKDIWYEVNWGGKKAFIKKEHITKL